jgi:phosphonate transport system substrate-binding protein
MNIHRRLFSAAGLGWLVGAGTLVTSVTAQASGTLVFGVIAPRAVEQTRDNWTPYVKRMAAAIGQPMELNVFESQALLVKSFVAGQVDLAWMGNAPALEVVESGVGAVFAQMVTKEGNHGYKSQLFVSSKATQLNSLSDVLTKASTLKFSDGEPKSTSGFLVPYYFAFQKSGINDTKLIFKEVEIGTHQQNLKKVAEGKVDVATANNEEAAFFARDFPELAKNLKPIWDSPLIPQSPLLWKAALPAETKRKLKLFIDNFGASSADEKEILLKVNGLSRFRPSSNLQLVPIADMEMFKARQAINNDKTLSPEERTKRIDEVIKRGSRIELRLKLSGY